MADMTASLLGARDLKGDKVTNPQGENLGEIREIMIDVAAGRVAYAVISFGGFLGIGERSVAVPWDALRLSTRERELLTDLSKERLKRAPRFNEGHWPSGADRNFLADLYRYYGYTPYWAEAGEDAHNLAVGRDAAAEARRAGIGEAEHRDREELAASASAYDTGADPHADPAEASGVRHDAGAGDVSGGAMPRTWNTQNAGGMSDNDMDIRTPGGNVRSTDEAGHGTGAERPLEEEGIADASGEADEQDYYPDSRTSATGGGGWAFRSFGGGSLAGAGGGTTGLGELGGKGPGGSDIGGTAGEPGWMASRGAGKPSAGDSGEGHFHTTSEATDAYTDTSGNDERGGFTGGSADLLDTPDDAVSDDLPEGQGDTKAFQVGEDVSAVSGFTSRDPVDISGATGVSPAGMTGGSEGISAAEDLTVGSVDDLNTLGASPGMTETALPDENAPESVWGGSLTGVTSTDDTDDAQRDREPLRSDMGDSSRTGAAGSGRGHSPGDLRTTRRGSSSEESQEAQEERRRDIGKDEDC